MIFMPALHDIFSLYKRRAVFHVGFYYSNPSVDSKIVYMLDSKSAVHYHWFSSNYKLIFSEKIGPYYNIYILIKRIKVCL